jgi:uncharacterized protein involved in exopolysaccharide biosynthesis
MNDPARPDDSADRLSLLALANVTLRQRRLVLRVALLVVLAVVAFFLLRPRTYTVSTSFRLQTRTGQALNLSGLAAELGLTVPSADATQTPAFYIDLLRSREILGTAVTHRYPTAARPAASTVDLMEALEVSGDTPAIRRDRAMTKLSDAITALASPRTGVISLSLTLRDPVLAEAVVRQLLDEVNVFNLESRQSQAGSERRFVEQRLADVRQDLRGAEDRLQAFLQRNRDYRNSPQLSFEQDRLMREVSMQQQLYTSLAQSYEQAKIEEVRDTPVITIIDQPERPAEPDPRGLLKKSILAVVLGGVLGIGVALAREAFTRNGGQAELREFSELRREALEELRLRRRRSKAG